MNSLTKRGFRILRYFIKTKIEEKKELQSNIEHALIDLKDVIIEKSDHNRKLGLKDCISKEIFKVFDNMWLEPILPTVILEIGKRTDKIGKKIGSWLGKYAEYLAAGVIVASAIPPFLQFLYKLIVSPYQLGLDWLNWDLSQISIPVVFEILTYIPLILLFVYLTYKFSRKQKIPKDI